MALDPGVDEANAPEPPSGIVVVITTGEQDVSTTTVKLARVGPEDAPEAKLDVELPSDVGVLVAIESDEVPGGVPNNVPDDVIAVIKPLKMEVLFAKGAVGRVTGATVDNKDPDGAVDRPRVVFAKGATDEILPDSPAVGRVADATVDSKDPDGNAGRPRVVFAKGATGEILPNGPAAGVEVEFADESGNDAVLAFKSDVALIDKPEDGMVPVAAMGELGTGSVALGKGNVGDEGPGKTPDA